jgi:hypothetical protein
VRWWVCVVRGEGQRRTGGLSVVPTSYTGSCEMHLLCRTVAGSMVGAPDTHDTCVSSGRKRLLGSRRV